jgi:transposase InsO family protein
MIPPSWTFVMWGLYILGPFPQAVRGYRYLYIAINKFTKWLKVTPVVKINNQSAVKFIKSIVCRFGILNRIITDNGSQFTSGAFQGYYEDLGIQIFYVSIAHLESNGQVERGTVEIHKGLKTRTYDDLKKHGKKWVDELSHALWGNRTSPSQATEKTPFFLVHGVEVVLPPKVTMGFLCVQTYDEDV